MPAPASSKRPRRRAWALVKAPRSWPNSSLSTSVSGRAVQLTATKGWAARLLCWWTARATSSSEERIEEAFGHLGGDTLARIGHFENGHRRGAGGQAGLAGPGAQGDEPAARGVVGRILDEVDQDLLDLLGVGLHGHFGRGLELEPDARGFQLGAEQMLHLLEQRPGGEGLDPGRRRPGELQDIPDDSLQALDFGVDDGEVVGGGSVARGGAFEAVEAQLDGGEGIAHLVGDAGGERAQRGQLFLLIEQGMAPGQFGLERGNPDHLDHAQSGYSQNQGHPGREQDMKVKPSHGAPRIGDKPLESGLFGGAQFRGQSRDRRGVLLGPLGSGSWLRAGGRPHILLFEAGGSRHVIVQGGFDAAKGIALGRAGDQQFVGAHPQLHVGGLPLEIGHDRRVRRRAQTAQRCV